MPRTSYSAATHFGGVTFESNAGYQVTLSTLESKVDSLEAEKAKLKVVKAFLRREVEELKQDRRDVVSKVIPYAAIELVHSDKLGKLVGEKDYVTFNPLKRSANIPSLKRFSSFELIIRVYGGAMQRSHGVKKDILYRFPQISLYCGAWILIFLASFMSFGNNLLSRCLLSGLPEVGSPRILPLLQFPFLELSAGLLAMLCIMIHCLLFQTQSVKFICRKYSSESFLVVHSCARLFAIWASQLTMSMGASAGAMTLSFLLSPRGVSDDFVLSFLFLSRGAKVVLSLQPLESEF
nr:hypothetical protein [Tanacetum cinerariifolium]